MTGLSKKHNNVHKRKPGICSLDKLLASTKVHCQGCKIDQSVNIDQTKQLSLYMSNTLNNLINYLISYLRNIGLLCSIFISVVLLG
jgi:hypothetical protein